MKQSLSNPLETEAKFKAFSTMSFSSICLGMKVESRTNYVKFDEEFDSLQQLFETVNKTNVKRTTAKEKDWRELIPNSFLQSKIVVQGFNIEGEVTSVRLGVLANNIGKGWTKDTWTDTWLGVGCEPAVCTELPIFTAGNGCCLKSFCNNTHIPARALLYIQ